MAAEILDGETVNRWCRLSVDALGQARAAIDALNVFPVPDADTGTNPHITLMPAAEAAGSLAPGAAAAEVGCEVTYLLEAPPDAEVVRYGGGPVPLLIGME